MLVMKPNIRCFRLRAGNQAGPLLPAAAFDPNQLPPPPLLGLSLFSRKGRWSSDTLPASPNGDFKLGSFSFEARFVREEPVEEPEEVFFK